MAEKVIFHSEKKSVKVNWKKSGVFFHPRAKNGNGNGNGNRPLREANVVRDIRDKILVRLSTPKQMQCITKRTKYL